MIYKIILNSEKSIVLPTDLQLEERIKFCEDLIAKYPEEFEYVIPDKGNNYDFCQKVENRLSIMGEYIYDASEYKLVNVITEWGKRRNKRREIPFSHLEDSEVGMIDK